MDLQNRISLLVELGEFMLSEDPSWKDAKTRAFQHNAWFIPDFIDLSISQIVRTVPAKGLIGKMGIRISFSRAGKDSKKNRARYGRKYSTCRVP